MDEKGLVSFSGVSRNRKGWIRILEAVIAILLVSSVLLYIYPRASQRPDLSEYMYDLEREILNDMVLDVQLRKAVLEEDLQTIGDFVNESIPPAYGHVVKICDLTDAKGNIIPCKMDEYVEADIYVEEVVISSEIGSLYKPKKVRLFVWVA